MRGRRRAPGGLPRPEGLPGYGQQLLFPGYAEWLESKYGTYDSQDGPSGTAGKLL